MGCCRWTRTVNGQVSEQLISIVGVQKIIDDVHIVEFAPNDWRSVFIREMIQSSAKLQRLRIGFSLIRRVGVNWDL